MVKKVATFLGNCFLIFVLFLLAIKYIHPYPVPLSKEHQHILMKMSEFFGVDDAEEFYIATITFIEFILAMTTFFIVKYLIMNFPRNKLKTCGKNPAYFYLLTLRLSVNCTLTSIYNIVLVIYFFSIWFFLYWYCRLWRNLSRNVTYHFIFRFSIYGEKKYKYNKIKSIFHFS